MSWQAVAYRPPRLSAEAAALARAFACRRGGIAVAGLAIRPVRAPDPVADPVRLALAFPAATGLATVPRALCSELLGALDPAAVQATDAAAVLLLELALQPAFAALSAVAPALLPDLAVAPEPVLPCDGDALGLAVQCQGGPEHRLHLQLPRPVALAVAAALTGLPVRPRKLPDLPVPLRLRAMAADVTLAELRGLRPGDVVLANALAGSYVLLVAGEYLVWQARHDGAVLHVAGAASVARDVGLGGWMMTGEDIDHDAGEAMASFDALPVRLVFELGRLELPLRELAAIGPGHVFELARSADQPLDILANGQRIGRGRIVTIGESLGVQVVWIAAAS